MPTTTLGTLNPGTLTENQIKESPRPEAGRGLSLISGIPGQNAQMALDIADRGYVLQLGEVVMEDSASNLLQNKLVKEAYLGL